jgi:hypothetical protein
MSPASASAVSLVVQLFGSVGAFGLVAGGSESEVPKLAT